MSKHWGVAYSLVIQALREIGKDKTRSAELKQIIKLLKKEDRQLLMHDIKLAPEWIKQIMKEAIDEKVFKTSNVAKTETLFQSVSDY